jgi:hypothetical protein
MSAESRPKGYIPAKPSIVDEVESLVGFVALIDVLGFRELVGRDENILKVREYVNTVQDCLKDERYSQLQFVLFSDNLVVNTRDDKRESFIALVHACSDVLFNLARHEIAVRGGIAHGSFMRSLNMQQGVILAGRPIVEAEHYQHRQNWVGIMLTPSVVRRDNEALQKELSAIPEPKGSEKDREWLERISLPLHLKRWEKIPFHDDTTNGGRFDGLVVVPLRPDISSRADVIRSLNNTLQCCQRMKAVAPNPASQDKYTETMKFLQEVRDEWDAFRPSVS